MSLDQNATLPQRRIDQNSESGKALQRVVQVKLKDFLGQEYADDVLPLYIVVMLAHGNQAELVTDNLEAFLGHAPAQLFVQWLFTHLAESGDKYAEPDAEDNRSAESSSQGGQSLGKAGSEDGEASVMDEDEPPQPSPKEAPQAEAVTQQTSDPAHALQKQGNGHHRQEPDVHAYDRGSKRPTSPNRHLPEAHAHDQERRKRRNGDYDSDYRATHRYGGSDLHYGRDQTDFRDPHSNRRYGRSHDDRPLYKASRHRSPARNYSHESTPYGDRHSRDALSGHMRSRRDGHSRDHYSQTDRHPKRRRSDPMGDDSVYGQRAERDHRSLGGRMRSDAIMERAEHRQGQQQQNQDPDQDAAPEPEMRRGPSVRSMVQKISSVEPEEEQEEDRKAAVRAQVQQPVRLFETAMRSVAAPPQPNRPSVFDRLTLQAAKGNNAAAVTASAVVRQLRRTAAAAAVSSEGQDSSSILALKQQLTAMEHEVTKLRKQQQAVLSNVAALPTAAAVATTAGLGDCNSVVVHNVHFSATPEILAAHFSGCGPTTRVTLLKDKATGHPTGTAYVQFLTSTQAAAALVLTGSALLQRPINVALKSPKPLHSHLSNFQHASPRVAAAPYAPFALQYGEPQYAAAQYSGRGRWTPKGAGRGRSWRGGAQGSKGGRGSLQSKSNVYIRPGLKQ